MESPTKSAAAGATVGATDEGPSAAPRGAIGRLALQPTLQGVLVGLLLLTVIVLAVVGYLTRREATDNLEHQILLSMTRRVASEVGAYLEPGPHTVEDLDLRARYGRLDLADRARLADFLADRLRYERTISQLMYGDAATGSVVGAFRADDQIVTILADPAVDRDRPRAAAVAVDGSQQPYNGSVPPELDARERPWFRAGEAARAGPVWNGPFVGLNGTPMLSVSGAVRDPASDAPRGVWAAQFYVAALDDILRRTAADRPGMQVLLFTREGTLVASATPVEPERVRAAGRALPIPLAELPVETPLAARFSYNDENWAGGVEGFRLGGQDWFAGFYLPEAGLLAAVYESQRLGALAGLAFLILGLGLGALVAARIARPLRQIADDLTRVAQFHLSPAPAPRSLVKEVAIVADAVDRMKASLRSFSRYIPTDIVRDLLARGEEARLGGETRPLTIHFSDIEGFTSLAEALTPAQVVQSLAEYLDCMTETIRLSDGTVDKFMGDGIMAFWNAPGAVPDHAARACGAALEAQRRLAALQAAWAAAGTPVFRARIGLHTGEALVGNFGTPERFAYTAMGDDVNLASRLEGLNKQYGTYLMASEAVHAAAGEAFEWRALDRVAVKGRHAGTLVYELLGERGQVAPDLLQARDRYEAALAAYFARQWAAAAADFQAAATLRPDDKAATVMAARCAQLAAEPPDASWAGIYVATEK